MKNKVTVFWCTSRTEAHDKSDLYYISSPTARRIEDDRETREIRIFAKSDRPLAVFRY